jgi:hypothetical protein
MKHLFFFGLLFLIGNLHAQIVNKKLKETYPSRFYFESQRMVVHRNLVSNDDFLPTPLGERANETQLSVWSHQLGICIGLSKYFYFDGGVSWLQNGEAYAFSALDSDSSYTYQTRYRYLALPLQLKTTFGKKVKLYTGVGVVPALYQGYKQEIQWTNPLGAKYDDVIKVNNAMNSFTLSWIGSIGLEAELKNNYAFRLGGLYRYQLNNSYNPYEAFVHQSFGWGINIGISKSL